MDNLLENLNKEQLKAVTHKDGPLLIVAGAGTGKTTVITQRIAYIIEQGRARADEILALTFTEKAAGEMEERVDRLLPIGYLDLWISTFHSFGERILRDYGLEIGLPADFKLLNEFQQWAMIKNNLNKFKLDYYRPLGNPTKFIHALIKHFSRAKDEDISPTQYLQYADELRQNMDSMLNGGAVKRYKKQETITKQIPNSKFQIPNLNNDNSEINQEIAQQEIARINEVANAYHAYQQLLLDNNFLDFGDLINYCLKLFRSRPAILAKFKKQFKYILVDEFQDTNWAQYELVKILAASKNLPAGKAGNLVVVGDDDQCLPGSSLVLTKNSNKRIDKIKPGEEVATAVGKGYLSYSKVNYVNKNRKKAKLISFKTKSGHKITTTSNHKMFCFIPPSRFHHSISRNNDKVFYYVYLMHKQELGWRLGITNDLAVRLKLERSADRIVAIKSFTTEEEARYNEILLSLKYGIPTVCFMERKGVMATRKWSEKLYKDLNIYLNIKKLAEELDIDLNGHQVCLGAVNRGNKVRIKIILEMCYRNYRSKHSKGIFLKNPKVIHSLTLETSHKPTLIKLRAMGFNLNKSKKGERLRVSSVNLENLGRIAKKIQKETNGIIENRIKVGKTNIAHKKALIVPASNIFSGMFMPIVTNKGIIYDQVIEKKEAFKELLVYDLEVERTHNFIANGIVVHNSIYKFRGASASNILQFKIDYPKSNEITLTQNYRNKQSILNLSYEFIKLNNPNRLEYQLNKTQKLDKKLIAQEKGEGAIEVIKGANLQDEVRQVIEKIVELKIADKQASWNDFAILVRANEAAKGFCQTLEAADLPYQFFSSRGLYAKPVVMDVIAYFKMLDNYHESTALYRILNLPIFKFSYQELVNFNYWAKKKSWSLHEVLKSAAGLKLGPEIQAKINKVMDLINKHTAMVRDKSASEVMIAFLEDSGYLKYLMGQNDKEARQASSYLGQFIKRIKTFEADSNDKSVKAFLNELNMEIESGEQGGLTPDLEAGPEMIRIMTVHSAKGLEFKYVFIVNLIDKRFPAIERREPISVPDALIKEILPSGDIHLEEERRLFYVAMTRAKDGLYFSWAPDYGGARERKPSRFLIECGLVDAKKDQKTSNAKLERGSLLHAADSRQKIKNKQEAVSYTLPSYYSYTQLAAYSNCPYQYRFAHVLKVPVGGKQQFSFGQTMHLALQKLFSLIKERRGFGQNSLFDPMRKDNNSAKAQIKEASISFNEILELYEQSWIDSWYNTKEEKIKYKKKGKEILKSFYDKHHDNWPKALSLEQSFKLRLGGYIIYGKIDRVDEISENEVQIVDYKTGQAKEEKNISLDNKEQLLIYQMAAEQVLEKKVGNLQFYYLDNNTELNFLGSSNDILKMQDRLINKIKAIEESIKTDIFPPKTSLCKYCDFQGICEFRKI